ncbi:unnamed protein product, partial [Polarella glacialis]
DADIILFSCHDTFPEATLLVAPQCALHLLCATSIFLFHGGCSIVSLEMEHVTLYHALACENIYVVKCSCYLREQLNSTLQRCQVCTASFLLSAACVTASKHGSPLTPPPSLGMMPLWLGGQQFAHRALVTEESDNEVAGSRTRVRVLYKVLPVLGACACLVAVAAWLGKDAPKLRSSKVTGEVVSKSVAMEPLDNPSTFPDFTVKRVLHNNLGGQGPDSGEPTIVYHVEASNMDDDLDLVMEALNPQDFKPWDVKKAGMWYKYQSVNIKGGSELHARFTFRNHRTHEPVTLPLFDMEFFDMDEQSPHVGREKITFHGQWTEYMLEKDALMSTTVSGAHDEDLSFESTTTGTGSDNPADPDKLTLGEARKAFGITYRHTHSFDVTMSASAAPWPRFFIFMPKPSLLTLKSKDELDEYGEAPRWVDLTPSRDIMGVVPPHDLITFDHWTVKVGDIVKKGDCILLAKSANGHLSEVTAPTDGTIIALEPILATGMSIKREANVALIKVPVWIDLIASPEDEVAVVPLGDLKFFDHWTVRVGDIVKKGDTILWAKSEHGKSSELKSPRHGTVKALEPVLQNGRLFKTGAAVAVIQVPPVWVDLIATKNDRDVVTPAELTTFDHWAVKVGDVVQEGGPILWAKSDKGFLSLVNSTATGSVIALEPFLEKGRPIKTGAAVALIHLPVPGMNMVPLLLALALAAALLAAFLMWPKNAKPAELVSSVEEEPMIAKDTESAEQAQAAAIKLAEDAKLGKLEEEMRVATAAAAVAATEAANKLAEDAKSAKLQQDLADAAATAQEAAAKLAEDAKSAKLEADLKVAAAATARPTSVTITFERGLEEDLTVIFTKRPLGFEYGPQAKGGCCAAGSSGKWAVTKITAGVEQVKALKVGDVILKIDGVAVDTKKDKPEFDELIKKTVMMLPEA